MSSWVSSAQADTYFTTRLGASDYWGVETPKDAALQTAENHLIASGDYNFPETVSEVMRNAVCEQALFLLIHGDDMERRLGLQDQGVNQAGVVGERYDRPNGFPICRAARALLTPYSVNRSFRGGRIERSID